MKIKLLIDVLYYLIGNVLTKSIGLLSIPIYTSFLTISEYGRLSYFNSMVSVFTIIVSGLICSSISRYYYDNNENISFDDFFIASSIIQSAFLLVLNCIVFAVNFFVKIEENQFFMAIMIVSSLKVINTLYFHVYQPRQLSSKIFYRQAFESLSIFLLSYCFLKGSVFFGEFNVITSQLIIFLILSIFIVFDLIKFLKLDFKIISFSSFIKSFNYIAHYSSYLWFSAIISTGLLQLDKIYIKHNFSSHDLGVYALAFNVAFLIKVISVSLFSSFTPRLMEFYSKDLYISARSMLSILRVTLYFSIAFLCTFSGEIISFIPNGNNYNGSDFLICILSLGFWFDTFSVSATTFYSYKKNTKKIIQSYLVSGSFFIFSLFIFSLDIYGVALIFVISNFITSILLIVRIGVSKICNPLDLIMSLSLCLIIFIGYSGTLGMSFLMLILTSAFILFFIFIFMKNEFLNIFWLKI